LDLFNTYDKISALSETSPFPCGEHQRWVLRQRSQQQSTLLGAKMDSARILQSMHPVEP
jgi:hypothetical protein